MQPSHWVLTDEEWCELCFAFIALSEAQHQLQTLLLADHPPSLRELWQTTTSYKDRSQAFFQTLSEQIRERVDLPEQQSYRS